MITVVTRDTQASLVLHLQLQDFPIPIFQSYYSSSSIFPLTTSLVFIFLPLENFTLSVQ